MEPDFEHCRCEGEARRYTHQGGGAQLSMQMEISAFWVIANYCGWSRSDCEEISSLPITCDWIFLSCVVGIVWCLCASEGLDGWALRRLPGAIV